MIRLLLIILVAISAVSCSESRSQAPTVMVVFGATGDLTAKKIIPAVERLEGEGLLPEKFALVGVARRTEAAFQKEGRHYVQTTFEDDQGYEKLAALLEEIDRDFGAKSNRIYYLSTQPSYFKTIVEKLHQHQLIYQPKERVWSRVMIEKPFGSDLESALDLQSSIAQYLDESQIYRIDHYLGKEGVQNLIDFRQRKDFDAIWNSEHIDRVEITLSEEIGIGNRAKLWEETGLLRDIVQNHMMQLLSLATMEPGGDLPDQKKRVLESIRPMQVEAVVRGQYGPGIIANANVVGYKEEKGVPSTSTAETFVKAALYIDNDRWQGVPFILQGGKRLPKQMTEIVVHFKSQKTLHIRIQPKPAIFFEDSPEIVFEPFPYTEAYQKLILDCIHGDQSSFVQKEEQIAAWQILTPVLEHWKKQETIPTYPAGTWGP